jgi:thiol-disulfide isomerase/thioredoxin
MVMPQSAVYVPRQEEAQRSRVVPLILAIVAVVGAILLGGSALANRVASEPTFEGVPFALNDGNATVLMFEAAGCGGCIRQKPLVQSLAEEYRSEVYVNYADTDSPANRSLILRYNITTIPSIVVMYDQGEMVAVFSGSTDMTELRGAVDQALSGSIGSAIPNTN